MSTKPVIGLDAKIEGKLEPGPISYQHPLADHLQEELAKVCRAYSEQHERIQELEAKLEQEKYAAEVWHRSWEQACDKLKIATEALEHIAGPANLEWSEPIEILRIRVLTAKEALERIGGAE